MLKKTNTLKKRNNERGDVIQSMMVISGFVVVATLGISFIGDAFTKVVKEQMHVSAQTKMEEIVKEIESLKVQSGGKKSDVLITQDNLANPDTKDLTISYAGHTSTINHNISHVVFSAKANTNGEYTLYAQDSSLVKDSKASSSEYLNISEVPAFLAYGSVTESFDKINNEE